MIQTTETKTKTETTQVTLKRGKVGDIWWIYGPESQVANGAKVAARRPDGRTTYVTVNWTYPNRGGVVQAVPAQIDEMAMNYLDSHETRITELDRRILRYIYENPGCTKHAAGVMGESMSKRGATYRNWRVTLNVHRGLIRDEGRANRSSLYLTEEGRRIVEER